MSNNDNAMARFLFAILQQKNLKDIDWNQVARNPILAQEITNGHAARMRYSRFRSAMLGLEPQRRNKTSKEKSNRVTKSKKESKDTKSKKDDQVKAESATSPAAGTDRTSPAPRIKQETIPSAYDNRLTPATMSATPTPTTQHVIQPRLLTPCSDTDMYPTAQALTSSPASEMINSQSAFDFSNPHCSHDPTQWQQSPMFSAFDPNYAFDGLGMGYDHQSLHHHGDYSAIPHPMADVEGEGINVKHEHWDNHCV
ncbi:hypothetical protein JX265_003157 [Neoarthrinium moseri]|uniref:Myb-like DNA-binding domain-containing protein n=1 Tax=Neoarthrinium moseri TaxID=1658444 RepID=A0A9Q0AUA9_9PEZI|nr:uncharacterized protein JN550_005607 [Neoarthrinium moseri]KAI1870017.1 hypothetical protein JN550_005607 [Neoarthrinium moseri]KAI1878980.1 hypothetical protein JX265_003157 [Neoarthrinium moseri]